jgi:hypothetical protein
VESSIQIDISTVSWDQYAKDTEPNPLSPVGRGLG